MTDRQPEDYVRPFEVDDSEFARGAEAGRVLETLVWMVQPDSEFCEKMLASNAEAALAIGEHVDRQVTSTDMENGWLLVTFGRVGTWARSKEPV